MSQPAAVLSVHGQVLASNPLFASAFSDAPGTPSTPDLIHALRSEDRGKLLAALSKEWGAGDSFHAKVLLPSGAFNLTLDILALQSEEQLFICQLAPDLGIDSTRLRFLLEHLDQGVWNYNTLSSSFSVTAAWRRLRRFEGGPNRIQIDHVQGDWLKRIHASDREEVRRLLQGQINGEIETVSYQYRYLCDDGEWIWIHTRSRVMTHDHLGQPVQIVGLDTDITEIKRNEIAHKELANMMQLAIDAAGIGIWQFDIEGGAIHWDNRILEIYGVSDGINNRTGSVWEDRLHPDDREVAVAHAEDCINKGLDFNQDYRIFTPDGELRYLRSAARMFVPEPGDPGRMVGVNLDVTEDYLRTAELEAAQKQLEHDAHHDALTGLANRRLLDDATHALIERLTPQDLFAVLHIDLDHFKQINDGLGHSAGDAVLVHVAGVLTKHVGGAGLVCRVGGDEFVVLLDDLRSTQWAQDLCHSMVEEMRAPIAIGGQRCTVGLSIGCAFGNGGDADTHEVFLNADVALYAAKSDGRSCFKVFAEGMHSVSRSEANAHHNLRAAMEDGQLTCAFQPQFDAKTLQMVGAEALVRWNCPERGVVMPDAFMPLAQRTGLVPRVDEYVLDHVLQMQADWEHAGLEIPLIALNISLERLLEPSFLTQVRDQVKPYHAIAFELLETAFLDDSDEPVLMVLDALRDAGIRIDLDDFGSGHSSVVALQTVRPDRVKIDQMLVAPLNTNPTQIHILSALASVAALEGCGVVVEGIETQTQLDALAAIECEALQGFLLGRPMPADDYAQMLVPKRRSASA